MLRGRRPDAVRPRRWRRRGSRCPRRARRRRRACRAARAITVPMSPGCGLNTPPSPSEPTPPPSRVIVATRRQRQVGAADREAARRRRHRSPSPGRRAALAGPRVPQPPTSAPVKAVRTAASAAAGKRRRRECSRPPATARADAGEDQCACPLPRKSGADGNRPLSALRARAHLHRMWNGSSSRWEISRYACAVPRVTIEPLGVTLDCDDGESVFACARRHNVLIPTACAGKATCGLCRVKMIAGEENVDAHQPRRAEAPRQHLLHHQAAAVVSAQADAAT